jgi:hypothetical protein
MGNKIWKNKYLDEKTPEKIKQKKEEKSGYAAITVKIK